jgi:hypothetical protein
MSPSKTVPPRAVIVTRPSDYDALLLRHGTREQARFYLETRGQKIEDVFARHEILERAVHLVTAAIPLPWRRARVGRADLDRFLFEPDDVVIAVGQDGLVANVAKYATGQRVIGVNPSKQLYPGVLVRHPPEAMRDLRIEERSMVSASTSDGQRLVALNEIYVGHRTHQSSRYTLAFGQKSERHSSSGLLVATGTGCTGWAKSVSLRREKCPPLPGATASELVFLVREAWPSITTGTELVHGIVAPKERVVITSEMNDNGVCFGDGIEDDRLELPYGQVITIARAERALQLAA